jgi:hypothetical protein
MLALFFHVVLSYIESHLSKNLKSGLRLRSMLPLLIASAPSFQRIGRTYSVLVIGFVRTLLTVLFTFYVTKNNKNKS